MWKKTKAVPNLPDPNKKHHYFAVFVIIGCFIALFLTNCSPDPQKPVPEINYFPLKIGQQAIFKRIIWKFRVVGNKTDTLRDTLFLKEQITQSYIDAFGSTVYRLDMDTARTLDGQFSFFKYGMLYRNRTECVRIEDNFAKIVIRYPIIYNDNWDGNKYNGNGAVNYRYASVGKVMILNDKTFKDCITVEQNAKDSTFIQDIYTYEIYAPEVGKIKRYDRNIQYISQGDPNIPPVIDEKSYIYEDIFLK